MKKVGIVLGGGGARGLCHVGVLEVLLENAVPIDILTGCSIGAVIGGAIAAGVPVKTIANIGRKFTNRTVFDWDVFQLKNGIAKGNRFINVYKRYVGEKCIEDCQTKFAAIATELKSGQLHVFKTGPVWKAVRASMSIPGIFHPVREGGKVFVDGGLIKRMPIAEARELGADIVIAVDPIGAPQAEPKLNTAAQLIEATYSLMDWKTARHEGKEADIFIVPDMGASSIVNFKKQDNLIQAGRYAALQALPQILKALGR